MNVSKVIRENPQLAAYAAALDLFNVPDSQVSAKQLIEYCGFLFPGVLLHFTDNTETEPTPALQLLEMRNNELTFFMQYSTGPIGKALFELGHLACVCARKTSGRPSSAEAAALDFLVGNGCCNGNTTVECQKVAAWCAALVMAALLKLSPKPVIREILIASAESDETYLRPLFNAIGSSFTLFEDNQKLPKKAGASRANFATSSSAERFEFVDWLACSMVLELW